MTTRSASFISLFLTAVLAFCLGWGPADYHIHIYGDYYIVCRGSAGSSLSRKLAPSNADDKSWMFSVICDGIATYVSDNSVIYGTTINGEYYLLNPPNKIMILRDAKQWEKTLGELGVHQLTLKQPSPPDDNLGSPRVGSWGWIAAGIGIAVGIILLASMVLIARKRRVSTIR